MPRTHKKPRPAQPSDQALHALCESSPIGVAELDNAGRFTRVNAALTRMLGRSEAEILKLTFNDVTHPEDCPGCEAFFLGLVKGRTTHFEIEKRFVRPDGTVVWAHTIVTAVRSGARSQGMIGMAIDISERKAAEAELARLKAALEARVEERTAELSYRDAVLTAQLESSPDGILVVDGNGKIVSHNARFVELWGISDEVLASRSDERALASVLSQLVDPEAFLASVRHLYEHRDEKRSDELRLRDGRVFERSSSPVRDARGGYHGRVWHFHDVTGRVRRENELREKTEELAASNAGLTVFAYAASHDLQSPLRKIVTFGDLLKARAKDGLDPVALDYLERMRASASGAAQLVTDLLTLSMISRDDYPLEEIDLGVMLVEIRLELEVEIAEAGAVIVAGALPVLRGHEVLLHSLLVNLISNAVKFRRPGAAPFVRVDSRREDGFVALTVSDNGIGFDQSYAEKIFHPFLRLNSARVFRGSGIGLTICRRVVQRYGGTLEASSLPGEGTTFTLRLPASMLASP